MNQHVLGGTIAFVIWSTFSTWYYVNYIRDFENGNESTTEIKVIEPMEIPPTIEVIPEKDSIDTQKVEMIPIELQRVFLFSKNTIELRKPDKLQQFIDSVRGNTQNRQLDVKVTGYACDLGNEAYNLQLSEKRAVGVASFIKSRTDYNVLTDFRGEAEPLVPNTSESNRTKNRRVVITIKSKDQ